MRPHLHVLEARFPISLRSRLAQVGLARRRCPEVQDAWLATRELGQTSSRSTPQGVLRRDPTRRTRSPRHETRRSPQLSLRGMVRSFPIGVHRPVPTSMLRRGVCKTTGNGVIWSQRCCAAASSWPASPRWAYVQFISYRADESVIGLFRSLWISHGGRRSLRGSGAVELRGLTLLE